MTRKTLGRSRSARTMFGLLAGLVALVQAEAKADQFGFNTTGSATGQNVVLNSFSEGAGNVLAVGGQTAITAAAAAGQSTSASFTAYYQANITPVDTTNHAVNVAPGQFTVVAKFNEFATNISASSNTVNFGLSANQAGSYFEIFYNPAAASNPLTGTGFATDSSTAQMIYSGSLSNSNLGVFTNNGLNTGPTANNNLDQVTNPTANPAVQQSVSGNGGETFYINTTFANSKFFLTPIGLQTFSTTNDVAFHQTAASQKFIDLDSSTANSPSYVTPVLPTVNGIGTSTTNRQDFQFEAIASSSFSPLGAVPEPASLAMTAFGLGLVGYRSLRARRRQAARA